MDDREIRALIAHVRAGRLSRRAFTRIMLGLGLTGPLAAQMLGAAGVLAQPRADGFTPTRRGGGGQLKVLWWQAPTLLNPHFAIGTKDQLGSRVFYEPLARLRPRRHCARSWPRRFRASRTAGSRRRPSVTWKLKRGVTWHDGEPFTADDFVFNWEFAADPATAASRSALSRHRAGREGRQPHRAARLQERRRRSGPTPSAASGHDHSEASVRPYMGARSREAPANLKPVGTGPYRFVDFRPGDLVRGEINPTYHMPNRPVLRHDRDQGRRRRRVGGARGAADRRVRLRLEPAGRGRRAPAARAGRQGPGRHRPRRRHRAHPAQRHRPVEGGRRRAVVSVKTAHPFLTDPAVRQAINLLVDRGAVQEQLYGRLGQATPNFLNGPTRFRSPNTRWEFNVDKANELLDGAGWKRGADGVRAKDGKRLKVVFQTSINPRAAEGAEDRQAGLREGGHRGRAEVGRRVRVLLVRRRQPRHLHASSTPTCRCTTSARARPTRRRFMRPVTSCGDRDEGEQVGAAQHHALAQRGVRPALESRRERAGSGEAGGAVHSDERHADSERRGDPDRVAQLGGRSVESPQRQRPLRLGFLSVAPRVLAPAVLTPRRAKR